jgi:DNA-directed RNA polymerase subunit beta
MAETFNGRKRIRKQFGHIREVAEMPNLIEVQKSSYDDFLMVKEPAGGRSADHGLQAVFKSVFPISDFSGRATLEFVRYDFEPPKYDVDECMQRDMTFSAPLKVKLRLIVFDVNEETGSKSIKDVKEQDVYMGDMPLMTLNGTFVINGTERVIVSQMHRSITTAAARMPPASCCSQPASFRTAARGSTSSLTRRTTSTFASIAAASCR